MPDRHERGKPFREYDFQFWVTANRGRIRPGVVHDPDRPLRNQAFEFRRTAMIGPQKIGKGPLTATDAALSACGPAEFCGWASERDVYRCCDQGCPCGWEYPYLPGEPMGERHPSPLVQIMATSEDQVDNIWRPLVSMIHLGPLRELLAPRETFIRIRGLSDDPEMDRIDRITASAQSRLGNPVTDAYMDESGLFTRTNKLRKVAETIRRDADGIVRLELNNEALFQFGPLDQGWWPDGLYTAPTDEALLYDVQKTKDFGFNMIRKHIKVEPARWYTHCDRLGIIVWQDMPSGDRNPEWQNRRYFDGTELKRSAESEAYYHKEWKEIMDCLYSYPCIGTWVPFNEAWGQFKTVEIAEWTKQYDPTRLVNPASGGNHYTCGDMLDLHNYPQPEMYLYDAQRATVLGEYGGIGLVLKDHLWEPNRNWGYVQFNSSKEVTDEYVKYADMLYQMIKRGFSAAVYTQTTDVEVEVNGLMTYDRKVIKLDEKRVKEINTRICNSLKK